MPEFVNSGLYFFQDENNFINPLLQVGSGCEKSDGSGSGGPKINGTGTGGPKSTDPSGSSSLENTSVVSGCFLSSVNCLLFIKVISCVFLHYAM